MSMLPKFHCELNPIERAQAKQYAHVYYTYEVYSC